MVKVLHIINGLGIGGAEIILCNLLSEMDSAKYNSAVVSLTDVGIVGERISAMGYTVEALGVRRGIGNVCALHRIARVVRKEKPDIVQSWMYHSNVLVELSSMLMRWKAPIVWGIRHSLHDLGNEKLLTRAVIRAGATLSRRRDAIVYNSYNSAKQHGDYGYASESAHVIQNGVDCEKYKPDLQKRSEMRQGLELPDGCFVIGHLARYHPVKDHEVFVELARRLIVGERDVYFVMGGEGVSADNDRLTHAIERAGLSRRIKLLGYVDDVARFMNGLDCLVSTSRGEGFPNVAAQAMACGVPCVVTDVGDSASIVHGVGRVVQARNPAALSQALHEVLVMDVRKRRRLGEKARSRIVNDFNIGAMAESYEKLYRSVLS